LRIEKERIREIPFREGSVQKIQIGHVVSDEGTKLFRYTRSIEFVRARYRITVQFARPDEYTPYVFDVIRPAHGTALDIRPDSETARETWKVDSPIKRDLTEAVETIYRLDIESP
jgi:hypothetical protein